MKNIHGQCHVVMNNYQLTTLKGSSVINEDLLNFGILLLEI